MNGAPPDTSAGALFDGFMHPIGTSPWPDIGSMWKARPVCRVLTPMDLIGGNLVPDWDGTCEAVYALPAGGPAPIPDAILSHLVVAADKGGAIALHATNDDAITAAIDSILSLSGGGHG